MSVTMCSKCNERPDRPTSPGPLSKGGKQHDHNPPPRPPRGNPAMGADSAPREHPVPAQYGGHG